MGGGRNRWRYMMGKGERVVKVFPTHEQIFVRIVINAILHARSVCRREKHLDTSIERKHQFVVTLRREMRMNSWDHHDMEHLCDPKRWLDAGVPHPTYCKKEYHDKLEEAYMQANSKETQSMDTMNACLEKETDVINKLKEVNSEADKLFADIKNLASGM